MDRSVVAEKKSAVEANSAQGAVATLNGHVVQFYVFQSEDYLGWDCFDKTAISIGKSADADLVLDDPQIADIQAKIEVKELRLIIHDQHHSGLIRVNNEVVSSCLLAPLDAVTIGPYTIKVRIKPMKRKVVQLKPMSGQPESDSLISGGNGAAPEKQTEASVNSNTPAAKPASQEKNADQTIPRQSPRPATSENKKPLRPQPASPARWSLSSWNPLKTKKVETKKINKPARARVLENPAKVEGPERPQKLISPQKTPASLAPVATGRDGKTAEDGRVVPPPEAKTPSSATKPEPAKPNPAPVDEDILACLELLEGVSAKDEDPERKPVSLDTLLTAEVETVAAPVAMATEAQEERLEALQLEAQLFADFEPPAAVQQPSQKPKKSAVRQPVAEKAWPFKPEVAWEEDDEDDEEDLEASFSLREKLVADSEPVRKRGNQQAVLQVIRVRNDQVLDVRYLGLKDKYRVAGQRRAQTIAENRGDKGCYIYIDREQFIGRVEPENEPPLTGKDLCLPSKQVGRRKKFRAEIPRRGQAIVAHGRDEYIIRRTFHRPSPVVAESPRTKNKVLHTLLSSSMFHLVILLLAGMFVSLPSAEKTELPEARFVQIDTKQLEPLMNKPVAPTPVEKKLAKVEPPKEKPPVKLVTKAKPKITKVASKRKPEIKKVAKAAPKTSAEAGGGHKGNVRNRNIKKEGILGALGIPDGIQAGAEDALAAVTNIAAVSTSHASEGKLKVGGISRNLGSSKIELPTVGLVNTKGSSQLVASAGIAGQGSVAALEKGTTGQKQVMAMVSADLKAPVHVQGGMSREEVKKVIDQHMDEISYCYETALIEDPSLMGKMAFEWRILNDGAVGEVRIKSSSIRSDSLHSCIKRSIKSWTFPEPRGAEVVVSYPFIFDVVGF